MTTPDNLLKEMVFRLRPLLEEVVFLGGSATQLLVTDPAAPPLRITDDVDVIVEIGSRVEYAKFSKRLRNLGFKEDVSEGAPICRFTLSGMKLDVMPIDETILGFSNRWYASALKSAETIAFQGLTIRVVTAPHFLATKLEAFKGRGGGDVFASKDLEDIVSVIDGRDSLLPEVRASTTGLQTYIRREFADLLKNQDFVQALPGHLPGDEASQARFPRLVESLRALANLRISLRKKDATAKSRRKRRQT